MEVEPLSDPSLQLTARKKNRDFFSLFFYVHSAARTMHWNSRPLRWRPFNVWNQRAYIHLGWIFVETKKKWDRIRGLEMEGMNSVEEDGRWGGQEREVCEKKKKKYESLVYAWCRMSFKLFIRLVVVGGIALEDLSEHCTRDTTEASDARTSRLHCYVWKHWKLSGIVYS